MPSRKNRSKSKKKPSAIHAPSEDLVVTQLQATQSWRDVADLLCGWLGIPDPETRQGLKKTHKSFGIIVAKLEGLWKSAIQAQNYELASGIIAIYSRMCADVVLRRRIVETTDFLQKLFSLIPQPRCRSVVLEALADLTHLDQIEAIAEKAPLLLQILDDHIDDIHTRTFAWVVLSHTGRTALASGPASGTPNVLNVDAPRMIRTALKCMRFPRPPEELSSHVLSFLSGIAEYCGCDFFANPSAINFLLSCTRTEDIQVRAVALRALVGMNIPESMKTTERQGDAQQDSDKELTLLKDWPEHILDSLDDFGIAKCDTTLILLTLRDLEESATRDLQDHDFLRLGRKLSECIMRSDYVISAFDITLEDPYTGEISIDNRGLPFTSWLDALPYCSRKLREGGLPGDDDHADILDCKYLDYNKRHEDAQAVATGALRRGSRVGYFYYILSLNTTSAIGLRMAKNGLKCDNLPGHVKLNLLHRSAAHTFNVALSKLRESNYDQQALAEGCALARSAWEDTKTFIQTAPPDSRWMSEVCRMHTVFSLLLYGHEHGPNMPQLVEARHALQIAEEITRLLERPETDTALRLTVNLIYAKLAEASTEWDAVTSCYGEHRPEPSKDDGFGEDGLTAWLNKTGPEDVDGHGRVLTETRLHRFTVALKDSELCRCSWCGIPSTTLRRCRGCSTTRYCDSSCQRAHWTASHRVVCGRKQEHSASKKHY